LCLSDERLAFELVGQEREKDLALVKRFDGR
jgi:hypothetical protein